MCDPEDAETNQALKALAQVGGQTCNKEMREKQSDKESTNVIKNVSAEGLKHLGPFLEVIFFLISPTIVDRKSSHVKIFLTLG